jgi:hypothetical protein
MAGAGCASPALNEPVKWLVATGTQATGFTFAAALVPTIPTYFYNSAR